MCFYDAEPPDAYSEDVPRARKSHKCIECNREIQPQELYYVFNGIYRGEFETFKVCGECELARALIATEEMDAGCGGQESQCPFGLLSDAMSDHGIEQPAYADGQVFLQTRLDLWREQRAKYARSREAYLSAGTGI